MSVKLCAKDNFKYKYGPVEEEGVRKDKWYPTSDFGKEQDAQYVGHHWGSQTGEVWMRTGVEFLQLFLCTVPDVDSFVVEQKRVYVASFVIIDTETHVEFEIQFDFHKFVTVSSYRKQYQKPTEKLPRAHASPPVVEPLETEASQVQKRRSTKRRYNEKSSTAVDGSQMKRQKVYLVRGTPPVHYDQYDDLASEAEYSHVMPQPEEYLNGYFVRNQNVQHQEFQGSVAGDKVQDAHIDDDEFDSTEPVDEWQANQTAPETGRFQHVNQHQHQRFQGQFSPDVEPPHGLPVNSVVYQNDYDNGNHIDVYENDFTAPVDEMRFDQAATKTDSFQHVVQHQHQRFQGQREFTSEVEQPHELPARQGVYQDDFDNRYHIDNYEDDSMEPVDEWQCDQAAPEMNGSRHVAQHQHQRFQGQFSPYLEQSHGLPADSVVYQDGISSGNHIDDYEDDSTVPVDESQYYQAASEMNGFHHATQQQHHSFQERHDNLVADEQYSGLPACSVSMDDIEPQVYEDDDYEDDQMAPILDNTEEIEDVYNDAPEDFRMAPIPDNTEQFENAHEVVEEVIQEVPVVEFSNQFTYGQAENNDSYDINSPGHPQLWDTASSSTPAEETPESNGNFEFAADECDIDQDEYDVDLGKKMFELEFQKITGDK